VCVRGEEDEGWRIEECRIEIFQVIENSTLSDGCGNRLVSLGVWKVVEHCCGVSLASSAVLEFIAQSCPVSDKPTQCDVGKVGSGVGASSIINQGRRLSLQAPDTFTL